MPNLLLGPGMLLMVVLFGQLLVVLLAVVLAGSPAQTHSLL